MIDIMNEYNIIILINEEIDNYFGDSLDGSSEMRFASALYS